MNKISLTRRDFLRLSGLAAGGAVLAACGGGGQSGTRIMVDSWALSGAPFKEMATKYNVVYPDRKVTIEPTPGGWMTKVAGQIRSGKLQWSAAGVLTTFADLTAWVQLGITQPYDSLIAASSMEGAGSFISDMLAPVKDDIAYNGKLYAIPYSIENISYQWRTDLFAQAGITEPPKTWQALYDNAKAVKDVLRAQGNADTYPVGLDLGHLCRNLGSILCSISNKPYTDEGLYDWESDEMKESLRFIRKLIVDGLLPPSGGEGLEIYDMWRRGRLASLYSCSSRTVWAQKEFGFEKVSNAPIPTIDGSHHSGAMFWSNSLALLAEAPFAQQAMDFFIYALGPQNTDWQKAIIQAGQSPAFASSYGSIIDGDPAFANYQWMNGVRQDVETSTPAPKNYYYPIQNEAWSRWRPEYFKDGSTMTEEELITNVLKTTRELMSTVATSVPTMVIEK